MATFPRVSPLVASQVSVLPTAFPFWQTHQLVATPPIDFSFQNRKLKRTKWTRGKSSCGLLAVQRRHHRAQANRIASNQTSNTTRKRSEDTKESEVHRKCAWPVSPTLVFCFVFSPLFPFQPCCSSVALVQLIT